MHTAATRGHIGSWDGEAGMRAQRKASRGTQGSWEKEVCGKASKSGVGESSQEEEDRRRYMRYSGLGAGSRSQEAH